MDLQMETITAIMEIKTQQRKEKKKNKFTNIYKEKK